MRNRTLSKLGIASIVAGFLIATWTGVMAQGAKPLVEPGTPADLTLLYTGDVIGYLDPCG